MDRKKISSVAIIGLGAIGSFFADRIQPVLGGELRVIADGDRGRRLRKDGIIVNGKQRFFNIVSSQNDGGYADLVILCPKSAGLGQALKDVREYVGPETILLTPLNGVESEETADGCYGRDRILYSLMRISSVRTGNQVTFADETSYVEFGERTNDLSHLSEKVLRVKAFFDRVAIRSAIRADMQQAIWEKYVSNVSENQIAAVLDLPYGGWGACRDADELRLLVADEVIQIAHKKGIMIDKDYAKNHLQYLKKLPKGNKPSTLQDLLAGRRTEVDIFAGMVIRLGEEYGVSTPYNRFLYHAIRVLEVRNEAGRRDDCWS